MAKRRKVLSVRGPIAYLSCGHMIAVAPAFTRPKTLVCPQCSA